MIFRQGPFLLLRRYYLKAVAFVTQFPFQSLGDAFPIALASDSVIFLAARGSKL